MKIMEILQKIDLNKNSDSYISNVIHIKVKPIFQKNFKILLFLILCSIKILKIFKKFVYEFISLRLFYLPYLKNPILEKFFHQMKIIWKKFKL